MCHQTQSLHGDAIPTEHTLLADIDNTPSSKAPRTIWNNVDTLMARQRRCIIRAAISSQQKENSDNLQRWYALSSLANSKAPTQYPGRTTSTCQYHAGVNYYHARPTATDGSSTPMNHRPRCCHIHKATQSRSGGGRNPISTIIDVRK